MTNKIIAEAKKYIPIKSCIFLGNDTYTFDEFLELLINLPTEFADNAIQNFLKINPPEVIIYTEKQLAIYNATHWTINARKIHGLFAYHLKSSNFKYIRKQFSLRYKYKYIQELNILARAMLKSIEPYVKQDYYLQLYFYFLSKPSQRKEANNEHLIRAKNANRLPKDFCFSIAMTEYQLGKFRSAVEYFKKALGENELIDKNIYVYMIECYIKLDNFKKAKEIASKMDPAYKIIFKGAEILIKNFIDLE